MLGLSLRAEFLGPQMPGTAITLRTSDQQGAAQRQPDYILSITYPTADIQTALKAISTNRTGRPVVLMGDRGRGKSHIMAVMHHAIQSPNVVEDWLKSWGHQLGTDELKGYSMARGYVSITEPVHNHEYRLLWDLLFDRHPKGQYYRGQFAALDQPFPPRTLLEKMFQDQPTCLILDEFQTWYTGLPERDPKTGLLLRKYAFNFVQILSEIAKERPEILMLVVSVLDNRNEVFQQVHRQGPVVVDFRGPSAKQDRQKLLLHRLFENRRNIAEDEISGLVSAYGSERFRLLYGDRSEAERERLHQEVTGTWPFSPELLNVLEDNILLSQAAQETRDMIRILAQVYRSRGGAVPIITPADFFVDGGTDEVQTLVDSIAVQVGQEKLREIAQRNLEAVADSGAPVPHAREIVTAIWMRSMTPAKQTGGVPPQLELDITREQAIGDNAFQAELNLLIENSVNIHGDDVQGGPLWFGLEENPRSKVRACAKNTRLWHPGEVVAAGKAVYPGKDTAHIRNTLRHILVPETTQPSSRVIALGPNWEHDPWSEVDEADTPSKWDRPVLVVVPEKIDGGQTGQGARLGPWLAKHVPKRRNTVRFLLPASDAPGLYTDDELLYTARCSFLCSPEGWGIDPTYKALHQGFDRTLRLALRGRFNRVAVLRSWDFQQPERCTFEVVKISEQGGEIPAAVEAKIKKDLFDLTEFKALVARHVEDADFVGTLLDDLMEPPPPNTAEAIPFLGETKTFEEILSLAAEGALALNVAGTWIGRRPEDTTTEDARRYVQRAFRTGQEMRQIQLGKPSNVGGGTITAPSVTLGGTAQGGGVLGAGGPQGQSGTAEGGIGYGPSTPPGILALPIGADGAVGSGTDQTSPILSTTKKVAEPATGINLSGCFETWGVDSSQVLDSAKIELVGLTTQQVKQILQRIPSAFKATLEITYKEGDEL